MLTSDPKPIGNDLNIPGLDRLFDRTKAQVFMGSDPTFFGSLLCSLNFYWTADIPTAACGPTRLRWNPYFFLKLPEETRCTILMHELWHPARLHWLRMGTRDPEIWNWACDHRINNDLLKKGYSFKGVDPLLDRKYADMVEEDIYDDLVKNLPIINGSWGIEEDQGDMLGPDENDPDNDIEQITRVVQAVHAANLAGDGDPDLLGEVQILLKQFLAPQLPWEQLLRKFMQELSKHFRSWRRPNRRYPTMYLPSSAQDRGGLEHLAYIQDVSGSISDADNLRFNSEIKHIKDKFKPKKMTLLQFDTAIHRETVFDEKDKFEEIIIEGRGGTNLACVREWLIENKPSAAIIFSDMQCAPMEPLPFEIPILWVAVRARGTHVPFGKLIHMRE